MAERTGIEWCDSTWNPWIGCTRVSPACDHCYAAASTPARTLGVAWGAGQPRRRTSPSNWALPLRWNARLFWQCGACGWRGEEVRGLDGYCPNCCAGVLVPARRRVFCASLADVFDNEVDPQWRIDLLELIAATPNMDWLLLTKRIGNAEGMLDAALAVMSHGLTRWRDAPWPNVWLGATICNQVEADRDVPKLLALPAALRFLSMEPLLAPVDIYWAIGHWIGIAAGFLQRGRFSPGLEVLRPLDWIIAGGESGPKARPMHPEWVRSLRDQCAAAGVPFLFKQWGEWQVASLENGHYGCVMPDTGERYTWLGADGRTSNPSAIGLPDAYAMARVGKKAAGRVLDGRMHTACPEVPIG